MIARSSVAQPSLKLPCNLACLGCGYGHVSAGRCGDSRRWLDDCGRAQPSLWITLLQAIQRDAHVLPARVEEQGQYSQQHCEPQRLHPDD